MNDYTQDCFCDVNSQTHLYGDCPDLYPICDPETKTCTKAGDRAEKSRTIGLAVGLTTGAVVVSGIAVVLIYQAFFAVSAMSESSQSLLKGLTVSSH